MTVTRMGLGEDSDRLGFKRKVKRALLLRRATAITRRLANVDHQALADAVDRLEALADQQQAKDRAG